MTGLDLLMPTVKNIRNRFVTQLTKVSPEGMLEIVGCQFIADEPTIFGEPNEDWHKRELSWYLSQSLNVFDIPPPIPKIWQEVAASDGTINSNYGWCIFSAENGYQFVNAAEALRKNESTRQATMIYTRPSMHVEALHDGRYDFICTNTVQLFIRDGKLIYIVNMRSSDAVFGYKGDFAWHQWVQDEMVSTLKGFEMDVQRGPIVWNANSFHVYPRHRHLVQEYSDKMWEEGIA
jgi:thymidylate synthase